jgi:hypothetical protein
MEEMSSPQKAKKRCIFFSPVPCVREESAWCMIEEEDEDKYETDSISDDR